MANEALRDAIRHNSWATLELLAFCGDLTEEQLRRAGTGTFGDILATFNHVVYSDAGYLRSLGGHAATWTDEEDEVVGLQELRRRVEETAQGWEQLLSDQIDAERVLILDQGTYGTHAGIVIAQVLHHGSAHREQICAILTALGKEPPNVQAWAYADASGRSWEVEPARR